jgi:hypothetical protein
MPFGRREASDLLRLDGFPIVSKFAQVPANEVFGWQIDKNTEYGVQIHGS